ncbi:hypothetical protein EDD90_3100 [Streptomyces sp. Ag109_O5-1]|nr:hypothetical protein EDD90_3100 [Streptomyces sp. Ag109_O5-1]
MVSAYTLTFAGLLLLGARAGDILGRRQVLMTGILLFTLSAGGGAIGLPAGGMLADWLDWRWVFLRRRTDRTADRRPHPALR